MKTQIKNLIENGRETRPDYYVLRGPRSANELREFLKKRYTIFRNSNLTKVAPQNIMRMDLDAYDLRSYHLGVFTGVDGGEEKLVGYIRLVTETATPHTSWVIRVASESDELWSRIEAARKAPLPSMYYFPELNGRYQELKRRGEWVAEPSRFGLDPSARSRGICRFVINGIASFWYALGIENGFLTCDESHNPFYIPVGVERVPEIGEKYIEELDVNMTCMSLTRESLAPAVRDKIENTARMFSASDQIRYYPNRRGAREVSRVRYQQVQSGHQTVAG